MQKSFPLLLNDLTNYFIEMTKEIHYFIEPYKASSGLSVLHMVNSAGTPSSEEEWETLVHCRREQGKLYFWGSRPGKSQSCAGSLDHSSAL